MPTSQAKKSSPHRRFAILITSRLETKDTVTQPCNLMSHRQYLPAPRIDAPSYGDFNRCGTF
jgi:hypothetical protein